MADGTQIAKPFQLLNPGPLDKRRGPYATVAAACLAILNTTKLVDGVVVNYRDGLIVDIGTAGNYVSHWWKGGFADANLVPQQQNDNFALSATDLLRISAILNIQFSQGVKNPDWNYVADNIRRNAAGVWIISIVRDNGSGIREVAFEFNTTFNPGNGVVQVVALAKLDELGVALITINWSKVADGYNTGAPLLTALIAKNKYSKSASYPEELADKIFVKNNVFDKSTTDAVRLAAILDVRFTQGVKNPNWSYRIDVIQRNNAGTWYVHITRLDLNNAATVAFRFTRNTAPTGNTEQISLGSLLDETGVALITVDWSKIPDGYNAGSSTNLINRDRYYKLPLDGYNKAESDALYLKNTTFEKTATDSVRLAAILNVEFTNGVKNPEWTYLIDTVRKNSAGTWYIGVTRDNRAGTRQVCFSYISVPNPGDGVTRVTAIPQQDETGICYITVDWSKIADGYNAGTPGYVVSAINKSKYFSSADSWLKTEAYNKTDADGRFLKNTVFDRVATDAVRLSAILDITFTNGVKNPEWKYTVNSIRRNASGVWVVEISRDNGAGTVQIAFAFYTTINPESGGTSSIALSPRLDETGFALITIDWTKIADGSNTGATTNAGLIDKTKYYNKRLAIDKISLFSQKYFSTGKNPGFFGDSFTDYLSYYRAMLNAKWGIVTDIVYAVSGATLCDKVNTVYTGVSAKDADGVISDQSINTLSNQIQYFVDNQTEEPAFAFIFIGINDDISVGGGVVTDPALFEAQFTKPLADVDKKTIPGAMRFAFEKLKDKFPNMPIVFSTPIQAANGKQLVTFTKSKADNMLKAADRLGCPCINAFGESGVFSAREVANANGKYLMDGLHTNTNGSILLSNFLGNKLSNIL